MLMKDYPFVHWKVTTKHRQTGSWDENWHEVYVQVDDRATARISCRRNADVVKSIPQERISEQSQVTGVPKISLSRKCRGRPGLAACSEAVSQHRA